MPTEKEYMLEEATAAATYQPKLTAGRNINISEDNVISSPDPPPPGSTVTVTPNQMSGNLIATVTVDSNSYNLYSPIPQVMTGATSGVRGEQGLVPAPAIGYQDYVLYGDGTWKDPEIPNIIANPAVSATTDLTKIYIDGTVYEVSGGSSGSEVVECTQDEYDALPSSKLTDNKIYCISGIKELDSNYNYYKALNDTIVVRVYHEGEADEEIKWFFCGLTKTADNLDVPTNLLPYVPNPLTVSTTSQAMSPTNQESSYNYWIGWSASIGNTKIRTWNYSWGETASGTFWGVVDIKNGDEQTNLYEDPYVWISSSIKKIIVNGTEYGNTGGGGGSEVTPNPTGVATEGLTKLEIDGTIYSIDGGVPIEEEDIDPNDFVNNSESSMNISVDSTTNKLTYQWSGGTQIGTCSVLNYPIDLSIYTGAKVKITTGATAYSTTEFYGINVGVRSGYSTNYLGTTSTGWILQETFYDLNSTITYAFDFSTLTGTDNYFYICGGGWNFVVDEIVFYKKGESTKVIPNPSGEPTDTLETIGIDGVIYDFAGGSSHSDIPLELNIIQWNETSNMSSAVIDNKVQTTWGGGASIGSNFAFTSPIFLSNLIETKKITYNIVTGSCYNNGSTALYPRWNYTVGLCATPWTGSSGGYDSIPYLFKKEYPNSNTTYENEEIDLSDIQESFTQLYLVISCPGWNAAISDIILIDGGSKGGTEVIPNPPDQPTDTLTSIKINDTTYSIEGGSSGSTGVNLLFSTNSAQSTMNLTNNLFLYDLIQLNIVDSNGYTRGVTFSPLTLQSSQVIGFDNTYGYSWNRIESGTQIVEVSRNNFYIASIIGLNPSTPISDAYLTDGLVGSSGGTYINCNLDKNMDNGVYNITLKDGATEYTATIGWTGTMTVKFNGGAFELEITQTTAGLTYYSGSWRNITCDIVRIR